MADDDNLLVTISGPALSLLLYENARCPGGDQIGFLLGEVLIYVTKKVTDSERDVEGVKQHINIKSVVAYPLSEPFFNTPGEIYKDKLKSFLKESDKNVVGWYHYRKQYRLVATMRDRILHDELSNFFSKINPLHSKETFIFCVLTSHISDSGGTHKFKHLLFREESNILKPVPLKINNLGADATRPDGTDYKPIPKYSSCQADAFDEVCDSLRHDLKRLSGVQAVTLIQKAAESFLDKLIPEVTKTDQQVSELEQQLSELRNKFFTEKFERTQLENSMRKMEVDCKSDVPEPKSPASSDIFDSPKGRADSLSQGQSPSSSSSSSATKPSRRHLRQESGGDERKRDSTLSDRDLHLTTYAGASPKSPLGESSRSSPTLGRSRISSRGSSSSKQLPQPSYASRVRQSPNQDDYDS